MALKFDSFDGGRDSKERLLQGLLVAATKTPEKSLLVVFTDNGSKDLKLKDEILVSYIFLIILQKGMATYCLNFINKYLVHTATTGLLRVLGSSFISTFFTAIKKGETVGNFFGFDA